MNAINHSSFETMDLLRFSTAGSVDDGKSTLIGRLLYDSKSIFEDTLEAVEKTTAKRGGDGVDLALITDGLQAEREQGITIDVAYRYFATPKRKFIIADTPGHAQYTRNMVTGASTADLAIVLIDARKGAQEQSRRHALIASLLGIPHVVVAINKMDLVGYSQETFNAIRNDFAPFCEKLGAKSVTFIPMSALNGDMVVERGDNLDWYDGPPLLELLETVQVTDAKASAPFRFPVQLVCRPQTEELHDFRGYMGLIESGEVRVGDEVAVLPGGLRSRVKSIHVFNEALESANAPQSVTLTLTDEIDISRGSVLVRTDEAQPSVGQDIEAMVSWFDEEKASLGGRYLIKHGTTLVRAKLAAIDYVLDINTLERQTGNPELALNAIGRIRLKVQSPLVYDAYRDNRGAGAFILIDEFTNHTVAGGMIG